MRSIVGGVDRRATLRRGVLVLFGDRRADRRHAATQKLLRDRKLFGREGGEQRVAMRRRHRGLGRTSRTFGPRRTSTPRRSFRAGTTRRVLSSGRQCAVSIRAPRRGA